MATQPTVIEVGAGSLTPATGATIAFANAPLANDVLVTFLGVANPGVAMNAVAGWTNPLGGTTLVQTDAHEMLVLYHVVTTAEAAAATKTWTLSSLFSTAQNAEVQTAVVRGANPLAPMSGISTRFDSADNATPHVLAGVTPQAVAALVLSAVSNDGGRFYTTPAGWTSLRASGQAITVGLTLFRNTSVPVNGVPIAATNVTPGTPDEYASITLALAPLPVPVALAGTSGGSSASSGEVALYQQSAYCVFVEAWDAATAAWVPEPTCDVRTIAVDRGRSTYLDAFSAGAMTLQLANFDGLWNGWSPRAKWRTYGYDSPTNVPMRVRVVLAVLELPGADTDAMLFTGTTDSVIDTWPDIVDAQAIITATDGFKNLARHNGGVRALAGAGELAGARINRLLDDGAWPTNASPPPWLPVARRVDVGQVHLQATDLNGVTLDLLRVVGESEWGWVYMDERNALVFRQRDTLQTDPRMTETQWTFVDSDTVLPGQNPVCYSDLAMAVDEATIINIAQITPPGVATATSTNAASVARRGPRTWTRTDLPLVSQSEALGTASVVVLEYANDSERIESISFDALHHGMAHVRCAALCRINDRIRLVRSFPGEPPYVLDTELIVQGIHHEIVGGGLSVTLPGHATEGGIPDAWTVTLKTASARLVHEYGNWDQAPGGPPAVAGWDRSKWGL